MSAIEDDFLNRIRSELDRRQKKNPDGCSFPLDGSPENLEKIKKLIEDEYPHIDVEYDKDDNTYGDRLKITWSGNPKIRITHKKNE